MATDRPNLGPGTWKGATSHRPGPQLPAFCRSRRPTVLVALTSLSSLQRQLLLVLLCQLGTALLVIARPLLPSLTAASATATKATPKLDRSHADSASGTAAGVAPVKPLSGR